MTRNDRGDHGATPFLDLLYGPCASRIHSVRSHLTRLIVCTFMCVRVADLSHTTSVNTRQIDPPRVLPGGIIPRVRATTTPSDGRVPEGFNSSSSVTNTHENLITLFYSLDANFSRQRGRIRVGYFDAHFWKSRSETFSVTKR